MSIPEMGAASARARFRELTLGGTIGNHELFL